MAKTKQRIEEEKMQIQVVERTQQITLQDQEIIRKEKELEAKVKKPAEAERYRLEKLAEAQRWVLEPGSVAWWINRWFKCSTFHLSCSAQLIMEAEAEAESIRVRAPFISLLLFYIPLLFVTNDYSTVVFN